MSKLKHLQQIRNIRPVMCGPFVSTKRVLHWKRWQQELWRHPQPPDEKFESSVIGQHEPVRERTPPRKKDRFIKVEDGKERYGLIVWIDYEFDEAHVHYFDDGSIDTISRDLFELNTYGGRAKWRVE